MVPTMPLHRDWKEFLKLLTSQNVEYLIVGAHALAHHGIPRYTRDIDVFVRVTADNARKLERVLQQFGFASLGIAARDFLNPGMILQLGVEPYRIDILTSLTGLDFEEAWADRVAGELDGVPVSLLSAKSLRKNKLATGRAKDLADVEALLDKDASD
jgi:hypothetical protein